MQRQLLRNPASFVRRSHGTTRTRIGQSLYNSSLRVLRPFSNESSREGRADKNENLPEDWKNAVSKVWEALMILFSGVFIHHLSIYGMTNGHGNKRID